MNLPFIRLGLSGAAEKIVGAQDLATAHRSGMVAVFATPAMIALMEEAAVAALVDTLSPDLTSVGVSLDVRHLAATPAGISVHATATVTDVEGRIVTFEVMASDSVEEIGRGTHRRAIVDRAKFEKRSHFKSPSP